MLTSENIVQLFKNKRICIVGDIMLDEYIDATNKKKSTEYKHIYSYLISNKKTYLGGAANVANNIKKMGSIPYLVGVCGSDEAGSQLKKILKKNYISKAYLIQTNIKTTHKKRFFVDKIPLTRIDEEETMAYKIELNELIIERVNRVVQKHKPNALIFQDYNKGVLNKKTIQRIIRTCVEHKIPYFVDPKYANWTLYKNCTLLKPNQNEYNYFCKELKLENHNIEENIKEIQRKTKAKKVLITLGKKGNIGIDEYGKIIRQKIKNKVENADVCGAGDSVIALVCLAYLANVKLAEIARLANMAGYIACKNKHTYPIQINDIIDIMNKKY